MSVEDGLITYLEAQSGVTDLVSASTGNERIYITRLPQDGTTNATLPAITVQAVSHTHEAHMTAAAGLAKAVLQVDCWAATYLGARALSEAVRAELDGYRYTSTSSKWGTNNIRRVLLANENPLYEGTDDGSDAGAYRVSQDYDVWHTETVPTF